jgi:hypothetical protein
VRVLRELKRSLDMNIKEAAPGHFVPPPPGAAARAGFVGRRGAVDVFLYDPYSIALSKLSRGHRRDLADVRGLLEAAVLDRDRLQTLVAAALASDGARSLRFDPDLVRRRLAALLAEAGG